MTNPKAALREPALEDAICAAPDDPGPRMVYGDWLQAHGDPRGEWAAIMARREAQPDDVALRRASITFLASNASAIVGDGAKLLDSAYLGWRGGFVDEIRVQPGKSAKHDNVVALLSHATCRFVRHVALGRLPKLDKLIEIVAGLPLVSSVVVNDSAYGFGSVSADALASCRTLRRLTLVGAEVDTAMPQLESLVIHGDNSQPLERAAAGDLPNLRELCVLLDEWFAPLSEQIVDAVRALPKLRTLRLIGVTNADDLAATLAPIVPALALVDVSCSDLTARGLATLREWPGNPEVLALDTLTKTKGDPRVTSSKRSYLGLEDADPGAWLTYRLAHDGRDGVREIPGAGVGFYNAGANMMMKSDDLARAAIPFTEMAATLPAVDFGTYGLSNAAIAHERAGNLLEAELRARVALLHVPKEPNFHSILVDALRRTDQLELAAKALPAAISALARPPKHHHAGGAVACLFDCLLVLAQSGRHAEVLELAARFPRYALGPKYSNVPPRSTSAAECQAMVVVSAVMLGKLPVARAALKIVDAADSYHPVKHHARAVFAAATGNGQKVKSELARAKKANYRDLAWLEADLAVLARRATTPPKAKPKAKPKVKPKAKRGAAKPRRRITAAR